MEKEYRISNGIYYGISVKTPDGWRCEAPQRFHTYHAAIRAVKLIKNGTFSDDIDNNGVYHEGFYED